MSNICTTGCLPDWSLYKALTYAGYYELGGRAGLRWMCLRKPSWIQRAVLRYFIQAHWYDGAL